MSFGLSKENQSLSQIKAKADKLESYEKQLEIYVLRNAVESDYFRKLDIDDILGQRQFSYDEKKATSLQDEFYDDKEKLLSTILALNFSSSRLRNAGVINMCYNLTVCDLSSNYIKRIDGLRNCQNLTILDVHQNQIMELPTEEFWYGLEKLTDLYLHNNAISTFTELKKMKATKSLVILTIYDTPISIKQHYRHFVVNSIWSLRCLDNVVISDEELIEDAKFGSRFQALQPHFLIDQQLKSGEENWSLEDQIKKLQAKTSLINKIQAKFCPVLIIQRHIRGYIARMRYQYIVDTRLWAAVTIQRFYRSCRGLEYLNTNGASLQQFAFLNLSSPRLDYETYIKYRKSLDRTTWSDARLFVSAEDFQSKISRVFQTVADDGLQPLNENRRMKTKLYIDLNKLASSTARFIDESHAHQSPKIQKKAFKPATSEQAKLTSSGNVVDIERLSRSAGMNFVQLDRDQSSKGKKKIGNYFTQYKFLGQVIPEQEKKIELEHQPEKKDDTSKDMDGLVKFRLSVTRPPEAKHDVIEDLTSKTIEIARDIRDSIRDFERKKANAPIKIVEKKQQFTNDQKIFIRTHGTMKLTCFKAVDQAYKDRDRAEVLSGKILRVREMKQNRERSKELIKQMKDASLRNVLLTNASAKEELNNLLVENKQQFLNRQKTYISERTMSRERNKQLREERNLMNEFVCQNNAVAEALASHSISTAKEKTVNERTEQVNTSKTSTDQQKEVIKRFYEHRNLLLQSETAIERSKLDEKLNQRSLEQETVTKTRVQSLKKQRKKKKANIEKPVGLAFAPPRLPPLAIVSENKWDEWEKTPKKEIKERLHDRVSIWT